jgi:DNA-directed RNA polymerase specialized sigma24 family protein
MGLAVCQLEMEIATIISIPVGTVMSTLSRTLRRLQLTPNPSCEEANREL